MGIVTRKEYIKNIQLQSRSLINSTMDLVDDSKKFMYKILNKDLLNADILKMSDIFSLSTLSYMSTNKLVELIKGNNDNKNDGFLELVLTLKVKPKSISDNIRIVSVKNANILNLAIEKNIEFLPVKISWVGPQSIIGLGFWSITSMNDIPNKLYSLNGKSFFNNILNPSVTADFLNYKESDLNGIRHSLDSIMSIINMTPRISNDILGNNAYDWAIRLKEDSDINILTDEEIFNKSIYYGVFNNNLKNTMNINM